MSRALRKNLQFIFLGIKIDGMTKTTEEAPPVKQIRLALGITQEEMARRMECSISSARRFEQVGGLPRVAAMRSNLKRLAKQARIEVEGL